MNSLIKVDWGLQFDWKYQILHDFKTSTSFNEKSSDHVKDVHKLRVLTIFYINQTLLPGGVEN